MATSKGRGGAASKATASKKSSTPSKSSGRGGGSSPAKKAASGGGSASRGASKGVAAKKSAASKGTASKSAASKSPAKKSAPQKGASKAVAKKATASRGTASKSAASRSAGARGTASKASASKAAASKATASRKSIASKGAASKATAKKAPAKVATSRSASTSARGGAGARSAATARNTAAKSRARKSPSASGDPRNDLEKILQDLMKDIYYAEKKLTKALGKMARNATSPRLKQAFLTHQSQTEDQITKLEKAFSMLGFPAKAKKCVAMDGLIEEADEHIEEYAKGAGLDAAMIVGAQKVEHYEIAAYGSMRSFARTLGHNDVAMIFEQIREQESDTDELLTNLAESIVNPKAEEETKDVEGDGQSNRMTGSEDSEAGEDSSSSYSGREGGDDALSGEEDESDGEDVSISSLTDGSNREGESETGEPMGY